MKSKKQLKGHQPPVFINESLTPKQSEIYAEARKLMKTKSIHATWTRDGKTFLKDKVDAVPTKIEEKDQLTKYLKISLAGLMDKIKDNVTE